MWDELKKGRPHPLLVWLGLQPARALLLGEVVPGLECFRAEIVLRTANYRNRGGLKYTGL